MRMDPLGFNLLGVHGPCVFSIQTLLLSLLGPAVQYAKNFNRAQK